MLVKNEPDCVVSLTTWRGRINHPDLPKVLYSIFRQQTKYKFKVVLVLSEEEFPEKENIIPETIKLFVESEILEIIWCYKNTKAYKKLHPTIKKYSNIPIMTTDDDILLMSNAIETFMNIHQQYPNKILSEDGIFKKDFSPQIYLTGFFRLYPPNSLYDANEDDFLNFYDGLEDDAYNAILAIIKGTETIIKLNTKCVKIINDYELDKVALYKKYAKVNLQNLHNNFVNELNKRGIKL